MTDLVEDNVIASAQCKVARAQMRWGQTHPQVVKGLQNLASLHVLLNNYEEAKTVYWQVLEIQHRLYGSTHFSNSETLLWLGELYEAEENYSMAEQYYVGALWILDQNENCDADVLDRLLLRLNGIYHLVARRGNLNSVLKIEALRWRAAYSSFTKEEMSTEKVKPIHGLALTRESIVA